MMAAAGRVSLAKRPTPDHPCQCVDAARKAAIRTVRTMAVDALSPLGGTAPVDHASWRNLMIEIIRQLKGL